MYTLYHNPRCSKSRQALSILEEAGITFEIKEYLKDGLTVEEVKVLSTKLKKPIQDFIRKKESEFNNYKIDWTNDDSAAQALSETPKLLERPILVSEDRAIIGRPPEDIKKLFL